MSVSAQVPATLETDRLKLKQMINNLLSNAIKFTAEGSISLEAELAPDARHVRIHVRDTGAGIPVEQQARIFEKFSQGNAQISYEHGGQLTLESQVGKGSTFTITLPLPSAA
jgi:signal transduction histidine kinase